MEIEIEIVENKNKGIAILKLYGPNKKKESVVTVSRGKGSDPKFVIILAQKILKPFMNEILRGNLKKEESIENGTKHAITVKGEKVNLQKCPHCEETSYSMPGLKGHITKMHHGVVKKTEIVKPENEVKKLCDKTTTEHDIFISKEAEKIVTHLLEGVVCVSDDVGDITENEEITLEENTGEKTGNYINKCDNCDFEANTTRKYKALQLMKIHKDSCCFNKMKKVKKTADCVECSFIMNE